jgi:cell division protein FtsB
VVLAVPCSFLDIVHGAHTMGAEVMHPARPPHPVRRWLFRALGALALVACFGYLPTKVYGGAGLGRLRHLRQELSEIQGRNQASTAENEKLRAEVHALRYDLAAIERVARDELGLVKSGEIVFQIEDAR